MTLSTSSIRRGPPLSLQPLQVHKSTTYAMHQTTSVLSGGLCSVTLLFERIPHDFGFHMSGHCLKRLQAFKRAVCNIWLSDRKVALIINAGLST